MFSLLTWRILVAMISYLHCPKVYKVYHSFKSHSNYGNNSFICRSASVEASINWTCRRYFTSSVQGIGISFQLAITTPRINLTGYGTAAAQRYCSVVCARIYCAGIWFDRSAKNKNIIFNGKKTVVLYSDLSRTRYGFNLGQVFLSILRRTQSFY